PGGGGAGARRGGGGGGATTSAARVASVVLMVNLSTTRAWRAPATPPTQRMWKTQSRCPRERKLVERRASAHVMRQRTHSVWNRIQMTDLKLLALDAEELEVISATTQDAVLRVGDMGYARADRRVALLMNRCAWPESG